LTGVFAGKFVEKQKKRGYDEKPQGLAIDTTIRTKTKYRDLSTAQRTIRPSVASVEMTFVLGWAGENRQRLAQRVARVIHRRVEMGVILLREDRGGRSP